MTAVHRIETWRLRLSYRDFAGAHPLTIAAAVTQAMQRACGCSRRVRRAAYGQWRAQFLRRRDAKPAPRAYLSPGNIN